VLRFGLALLACCAPDPPDAVFGFAGRIEDTQQRASTIGLFVLPPEPMHYKLGDGTTVIGQFDLFFARNPPSAALDRGVGVALVGLLPGIATLPDGPVDITEIRLIGITTEHAVVFKRPDVTEPAWIRRFDEGFSCGRCVRIPDAPDELEPVDCALVTIQAYGTNPCRWY
jgi:hypothetical protein